MSRVGQTVYHSYMKLYEGLWLRTHGRVAIYHIRYETAGRLQWVYVTLYTPGITYRQLPVATCISNRCSLAYIVANSAAAYYCKHCQDYWQKPHAGAPQAADISLCNDWRVLWSEGRHPSRLQSPSPAALQVLSLPLPACFFSCACIVYCCRRGLLGRPAVSTSVCF
jgi:hypothetical protein